MSSCDAKLWKRCLFSLNCYIIVDFKNAALVCASRSSVLQSIPTPSILQYWKILIVLVFFINISCFLSLGVTFSFFWKTQDQQAKFLPASGGQVISSGFKICSNEAEGSVEFYTRGNAMMKWKASFSPPGKVYFIFLIIVLFDFILAQRCIGKSTTSGKRSGYIKVAVELCA